MIAFLKRLFRRRKAPQVTCLKDRPAMWDTERFLKKGELIELKPDQHIIYRNRRHRSALVESPMPDGGSANALFGSSHYQAPSPEPFSSGGGGGGGGDFAGGGASSSWDSSPSSCDSPSSDSSSSCSSSD